MHATSNAPQTSRFTMRPPQEQARVPALRNAPWHTRRAGWLRRVVRALAMVALPLVVGDVASAQTTLLQFSTTSLSGTEASVTATTVGPGILTGTLTRGSGITANAGSAYLTARNWIPSDSTTTTFSSALSGNRFFTFTAAPAANYSLAFTSVSGTAIASSSGPDAAGWAYSIDNFASAISGTVTAFTSAKAVTASSLTNTGITAATEFRFVEWRTGASGGIAGTGRIGTPTLSGSATLRSVSTLTWDGGQANGNWDAYDGYAANQSNWNLNNIPTSSLVDSLTFAGSTQTTSTNNISGLTVGSITFASGASAFTNSGNSLTLNVGISNSSSNLQTISHALVLASGTRGFDAASGNLVINGAISGAGGILEKLGTNVLTLSASNSHTGGTRLTAGTLRAGDNAAFGTGTLALNAGTITGTGSVARSFSNNVAVGGDVSLGDGTGTGPLAFSGAVDLGNATRQLTTVVSTTFSGAVTNGNITKAGNATLALASASSNFGTLTVNSGTVSIGANTAITGLGGSGGALNLSAGTLTLTPAASGTVSLPFTGSGGFTKAGSNALTLTANSSSYAGTTTVSAGTLYANGSLGGSISVSNGGTLAGSGTVGSVTMTTGATLSPGNSPGVLTAGDMTWSGGGNYNWQLFNATGSAGTGWDLVSGTGALTITGSAGNPFNFNLWTLSGTGPDVSGSATNFSPTTNYTWKVASFTGGITGASGNWYTINTSSTNGTSGFANTFAGTFSLATSGNDLNLVYTAPLVGSSWDYTATGGSWSTGANWNPATVPSGTAQLSFSGGGGTTNNDISLAGVSSLTFTGSASGPYTITGNSIALGSGGISNSSTFTQTISAPITLATDVTITANAGPLTLSGTVDNAGNTLTVTGSGNTSLGVVSGAGAFSKIGSGTATLTGAVASPNVTVGAGAVLMGGSDLLANTGTVTVSGGTLNMQSNSDTVGSLAISGGSLGGSGTLTAGTYALTGGTVNANLGTGTLNANSGAATLNGTSGAGTVNVGGGSLTTGGADKLANDAAVTISAGGLTLGGSDTVGSFAITGGTLGGSGQTLTAATYALQGGSVNASLGAGTVNVSGGTTSLGSAGRLNATSAVNVGGGQLTLGGNETVSTYTQSAGMLGGSGTLIAATYALQGGSVAANLGTGAVTVSAGTTSLASAGRLAATSNLTVSGGQLTLGGNETVGSYTQTGGTLGGSATLTAATYALQGGSVAANLGTGAITVSAGTTSLASAGRLAAASNLTVSGGQLTLGGNETVSSYTQTAGTLAGSATLTASTYALQGGSVAANLGTGAVTVSAGTTSLASAGRLAAASNLTVSGGQLTLGGNETVASYSQSAGTLGGSGTLTAATYALTGGSVSATLGAGTVNVSGGTTSLASAGRLNAAATVNVTGGQLTLGGNETVSTYTQSAGTLAGSGTLSASTYSISGGTLSATLGSGSVSMTGGSFIGNSGQTIANAITIGTSLQSSSPFVAYWNMQTDTPTSTSGTGLSIGSLVQGNNNGTTTMLGTTSTSSGYTLASGTVASGNNNAGAAAFIGAINTGSSTYFSVTLTGSAGYTFTLADVQLGSRSTGTGPAGYDLRSSLDSYAASLATGSLTNNSNWAAYQIVPTGTSGSGAVTYRIYGVNGSGTPTTNTANWRIDDLRLSGTTFFSSITPASATLGISSAGSTTYSGAISVTGTANLFAAASGTATFSGVISGAGSVTKTGLGTVILSGSNSYSGGTTISAGTLQVSNSSAFGSGAVTLASGATLDLNSLSFANAITNNGGTLLNASSFSGTSTVSGSTVYSGNVGGSVVVGNGGVATFSGSVNSLTVNAGGQATLGNGGSLSQVSLTNNGVLAVNQSGNTTIASAIGGSGSFQKDGSGVTTLTGASTFSGPTTVSAGGLVVNGSIASNVSVAAGATLGGSGSVGALSGAGQVGPGNSPGILTATSFGGSTGLDVSFEITGTAPNYGSPTNSLNDVLRLTSGSPFASDLTSGNVIDVYFNSADQGTYDGGFFTTLSAADLLTAVQNATWNFWAKDALGTQSYNGSNYKSLLSVAGITGASVTTTARTANFGSGNVTGSVTQFVVVPEPSSLALAGLGAAFAGYAAWKRRRAA